MDLELPAESPVAFGLHPNAEIAVKTEDADTLFRYILELQPRSAAVAGGEAGTSPLDRVRQLLESICEKIKAIKYPIEDIAQAVAEDRGPYQNVFLQECGRMNMLVSEMLRTLKELVRVSLVFECNLFSCTNGYLTTFSPYYVFYLYRIWV